MALQQYVSIGDKEVALHTVTGVDPKGKNGIRVLTTGGEMEFFDRFADEFREVWVSYKKAHDKRGGRPAKDELTGEGSE